MNKSPDSSAESARIAALVERFREIGESAMRELPLYNANLAVEAVGFRSFESQWIGILITPWFMNLMRLPEPPEPMDMAHIGRKLKATLPSGERELVQGGDEVIGAYQSLSLHSPMFAFQTQETARQEANRRLEELMRRSEEAVPVEDGRLRAEAEPRKISRRAFLRGATSEV